MAPQAKEREDVRSDVIFTEKLNFLAIRRWTIGDEIGDPLGAFGHEHPRNGFDNAVIMRRSVGDGKRRRVFS